MFRTRSFFRRLRIAGHDTRAMNEPGLGDDSSTAHAREGNGTGLGIMAVASHRASLTLVSSYPQATVYQ